MKRVYLLEIDTATVQMLIDAHPADSTLESAELNALLTDLLGQTVAYDSLPPRDAYAEAASRATGGNFKTQHATAVRGGMQLRGELFVSDEEVIDADAP